MFVRFRSTQLKRRIPRVSFARRLFGLFKLFAFLIAIGIIGWLLFHQTVHSKIRDTVQTVFSQKLDRTGLDANVGQASFVEGMGIRINDLNVSLASYEQPYLQNQTPVQSGLEVYEAFLHAPVSTTQLASGELNIERVEIRRAKLTLVRNQNGKMDFDHIIEKLSALEFESDSPTPVAFKDCEVVVIDQTRPNQRPISISNISLIVQPIIHEQRQILQINGSFKSRLISEINFVTYLDQQNGIWTSQVGATDATLSTDLIALLPDSIQSEFQNLQSLIGKINFQATATGATALNEMPAFKLTGDIAGFSIDDSRLPFPIKNASANFIVENGGLAVQNARGRIGQGDFVFNYSQTGLQERSGWHCDGKIEDFNFERSPQLEKFFTANGKKFCKEFSPRGTSNIQFNLTHDGTRLHRDIVGKLTNMSFSYFRMPYRADHCMGTVTIKDNRSDFDIESITSNQKILIKGFVKGTGMPNSSTYELNITVPGDLPIDPKMLDAVDAQPKLANVVRSFRPTGRVGGIGKFEKLAPNGQVKKTFDLRLKQCSVRHQHFDYPIYNISGLVHAENENFRFQGLRGNNSGGKVECDGTWNPTNGLDLVFFCKSIPLNDQLKFALKPEIREIWSGFRPRGTLDAMKVELKLPSGHKNVNLVVTADMQKPNSETDVNHLSIHPTWFPYEINNLTGQVKIGDGKIALANIQGRHQRTSIACEGEGAYRDDAWYVRLKNMLVMSLKVDEDLLSAVPSSLAPPVRQLEYDGLLTVSGEMTIAGNQVGTAATSTIAKTTPSPTTQVVSFSTTQSNRSGGDFVASPIPATSTQPTAQTPITRLYEQRTSMAWDLQLDMIQSKMQIGLPIEDVSGNVKMFGKYDGQNAECLCELDIESLTIYDAQITNVRGPIWLDNNHIAAGQFVQPPQDPANISPIAKPIKLIPVTGKMHKGSINFDAKMLSGGKGDFYLKTTLTDGCLATACREYAPSLENVSGRSFAAVEMTGDYTGTHANRGVGTIQLRDAKIYELPVFLALLKIPNFRKYNRTAFDSSNIDFTIEGDTIDFNRMEFIGDAISLIGNGRMNFDWDIDLNFYSVVGRDRINIPLISELYRASSQRVLWIQVDGTLDNPKTHHNVLPSLELPELRKLFQPGERAGLAKSLSGRSGPLNFGSSQQPKESTNQYERLSRPIGTSFFR